MAIVNSEVVLKIIHALENIKKSMNELSEAWDQANYNDDVFNALNQHYPFHKDFAELVLDVMDWEQHVKDKLKEKGYLD